MGIYQRRRAPDAPQIDRRMNSVARAQEFNSDGWSSIAWNLEGKRAHLFVVRKDTGFLCEHAAGVIERADADRARTTEADFER